MSIQGNLDFSYLRIVLFLSIFIYLLCTITNYQQMPFSI